MSERARIRKLLTRLHDQPLRRFPPIGESLDAPMSQGVYIIRDAKRRVLHVGRTVRGKKGLRQRLGNHLQARSSFVIKHLRGHGKRLRNGYTFQYLELPNARERVLLEYAATVWNCPKHLGDGARVLG